MDKITTDTRTVISRWTAEQIRKAYGDEYLDHFIIAAPVPRDAHAVDYDLLI